jgi:serine/threonine protein phosphatase PrpC
MRKGTGPAGPAGAVEEAMRRATAVGAPDDVTVVVIRHD